MKDDTLTALERQLIRHEGVRARPYRCTAGRWTVGCGRNIDANGFREDEILLMLRNDIAQVRHDLTDALPWLVKLDPVRRDVLVNMGFNLGVKGLLGFGGTLDHVKNGEYDQAADHMISTRWARQVGGRAVELAKQMRTGVYVHEYRSPG